MLRERERLKERQREEEDGGGGRGGRGGEGGEESSRREEWCQLGSSCSSLPAGRSDLWVKSSRISSSSQAPKWLRVHKGLQVMPVEESPPLSPAQVAESGTNYQLKLRCFGVICMLSGKTQWRGGKCMIQSEDHWKLAKRGKIWNSCLSKMLLKMLRGENMEGWSKTTMLD